ncbi:MAG: eukaryotic-like serine/threonine-protein kinase [Acidimicrobiaceae bacterium]
MLATDTVLGGRYRLGPIIGRGGGADVFRADDLKTMRQVAVKVLRAATADDLRRFALEAETLSRLDHPAIVRMCDQGEHEGVPYLVLDLIDGEPLSAVLLRGSLPEADVAHIGAVLADALAHAHAFGVVHRDVKPGNVLFDCDGRVHLTDFGIARLTDVTAITATGSVIGTAAYLSPEQVTGDGAGPHSDIYALGLVLLETLTGERAFAGSPSEAALARLHRSPEIPHTATGSFAALLGAMTASDPAMRPTAAGVAESLSLGASDAPVDPTAVLPVASDVTAAVPVYAAATPAPSAPAPFDGGRLRAPLIIAAVLALLLLLSSAFGDGGGLDVPATAATSTTTATTAPPTTAAPQTVPPTTAKDKKKPSDQGHGGD